jgi:hypothetical protein
MAENTGQGMVAARDRKLRARTRRMVNCDAVISLRKTSIINQLLCGLFDTLCL